MNILITGGAGFIGSHLSDYLLVQGHRVVVIDDLSTGSMDNLREAREPPLPIPRGYHLQSPVAGGGD